MLQNLLECIIRFCDFRNLPSEIEDIHRDSTVNIYLANGNFWSGKVTEFQSDFFCWNPEFVSITCTRELILATLVVHV